jgi:hypothetical protein
MGVAAGGDGYGGGDCGRGGGGGVVDSAGECWKGTFGSEPLNRWTSLIGADCRRAEPGRKFVMEALRYGYHRNFQIHSR